MKTLFDDDFFQLIGSALTSNGRTDYNIVDNDDDTTIELFLAGVKKDDINISVNEKSLTIEAERRKTKQNYRSTGMYYGKIEKIFRLPSNYDSSKITSTYVDGVLSIKIPLVKQQDVRKSKKVEIL